MGKKIIAAVTLAALLITGIGAALAAPGTVDDPFVTLSYLSTYAENLELITWDRVESSMNEVERDALNQLAVLSDSYLAQAGGKDYTDEFTSFILARDDRLSIPAGSTFLFQGGKGELDLASGYLIDVTSGSRVTSGGSLTAGHRYVAGDKTVCTYTALSDAAYLSLRGYYALEGRGWAYTPFTDITAEDWYYDSVRFVYDRNLFTGTGDGTTFSPNLTMSRAMLAVVLYRMAGSPYSGESYGFPDVPAESWYTDAANWAANHGVVTGTGNGSFAPNSDITREQMAVMLYRYARDYLGIDVSFEADLSSYPDSAKVSAWAKQAVAWAVGQGIITGTGTGALSPGSSANRSVVATMLQRFSDSLW